MSVQRTSHSTMSYAHWAQTGLGKQASCRLAASRVSEHDPCHGLLRVPGLRIVALHVFHRSSGDVSH